MKNINFKNLNKSIVSEGETRREAELREFIESNYSEEARTVGAEFNAMVMERLEKVKDAAYTGTAIIEAMKNVNRFAFIKNYTGHTDIQIDLLAHTFAEVEHI